MEKTTKPACSTWSLWVGREIEGKTDIGMYTIFVREYDGNRLDCAYDKFQDILTRAEAKVEAAIRRVWFCEGYNDIEVIREAISRGFRVAVELSPRNCLFPNELRPLVTIYFKLGVELKPGDYVCIGKPFNDEAFRMGDGEKVTPQFYEGDICIAE